MSIYKISKNSSSDLIVHNVNIAHYRLVQLSSLADQAKPFYDWIERIAQIIDSSDTDLNSFLMNSDKEKIKRLIRKSYTDGENSIASIPFLFDGVGRPYEHKKAVFFFFAWIIRDAPQQRLAPLIAKMDANFTKEQLQEDSLAELIVKYRNDVKSFSWGSIREVFIDRLEGSRRSLKGHAIETGVRTSVMTAIQTYYRSHLNYGIYKSVKLSDGQAKIGMDSADIYLVLEKHNGEIEHVYIPVKSRETEGGGHAHLFTRDIVSAVNNIESIDSRAHFAAVVVAENWDSKELNNISDMIDVVFHFDMNPNVFQEFDEGSQKLLNQYIQKVFDGK